MRAAALHCAQPPGWVGRMHCASAKRGVHAWVRPIAAHPGPARDAALTREMRQARHAYTALRFEKQRDYPIPAPCAELDDATRREFWRNVRGHPGAGAHFRQAGFVFPPGEATAPLLSTSAEVSATEIRVSLNHIVDRAIGDNWRRALDADNLRMELSMPNTYREIIQARHPALRAVTD